MLPIKIASRFCKALSRDPTIRPKLRSVVVFGSALRPEDFSPELSDIDVLVMVGRASRELSKRVREVASALSPRLSPVVLSRRQFCSALKRGDPGALLMLNGTPLLGLGEFEQIRRRGYRPTDRTVEVLIHHSFCALSIAVNDYLSGLELYESIGCAYHCARHALRGVAVKELGVLPESNRQILGVLAGRPKLREGFEKLLRARENPHELVKRRPRVLKSSAQAFKDKLGKLLLIAEEVASRASEICLGKRPKSLTALVKKAKGRMLSVGWEEGWRLTLEVKGELRTLKHPFD